MEKILSRGMLEAIQKIWQKERNATIQESEAVLSTALALYDELDKINFYSADAYEKGKISGWGEAIEKFKALSELKAKIRKVRNNIVPILCDPEGKVCIDGSDTDRDILQNAINDLASIGKGE